MAMTRLLALGPPAASVLSRTVRYVATAPSESLIQPTKILLSRRTPGHYDDAVGETPESCLPQSFTEDGTGIVFYYVRPPYRDGCNAVNLSFLHR